MDRTDIESNKEKYVTVGCDCGMVDKKRYTKEYFDEYNNEYDFIEKDIPTIFDNVFNKKYFMQFLDDDDMNNTIDELINRLNEQDNRIKELEYELNAFKPVIFEDMEKGMITLYTKDYDADEK